MSTMDGRSYNGVLVSYIDTGMLLKTLDIRDESSRRWLTHT